MRSLKETYTAQEVLELLSAISTAALGWAGQGLAPEHEWYSIAFQDVFELRKKYDALLAQTRWIPVSEGLPKREDHTVLGERYLVLHDRFYHNIDVFYPYDKTWYSKYYNVTEHVTHWMPLPPRPKENMRGEQ